MCFGYVTENTLCPIEYIANTCIVLFNSIKLVGKPLVSQIPFLFFFLNLKTQYFWAIFVTPVYFFFKILQKISQRINKMHVFQSISLLQRNDAIQ